MIALIKVDFPDPEAPTIAIFSPRRTVRSMSCRVGSDWARYWKEYPASSISGASSDAPPVSDTVTGRGSGIRSGYACVHRPTG